MAGAECMDTVPRLRLVRQICSDLWHHPLEHSQPGGLFPLSPSPPGVAKLLVDSRLQSLNPKP